MGRNQIEFCLAASNFPLLVTKWRNTVLFNKSKMGYKSAP